MVIILKQQGYEVNINVLMQDNKSATKLEQNSRKSCTCNSRQIDIKYFFVKDRVDKGEIKIEYCLTEIMLADFFSKPIQGNLFKFFRDIIMGYKTIEAVLPNTYKKQLINPKIKERVENENKNNDIMICDLMNNDNKNNCEEKVKDTVHRIDTNVGNKYVRCDDEVKINDINDNPKSGYIRLVSYGIWTRSM